MAKVLMIIAPRDFRDEELFQTKEALELEDHQVIIASTVIDKVKGMLGGVAKPDAVLEELNINDYDAIIFVGGSGSSTYFKSSIAHKLAKSAYESGKIVAAICIAPSILANAGLLKGKKATAYPSEEPNLKEKGADYI